MFNAQVTRLHPIETSLNNGKHICTFFLFLCKFFLLKRSYFLAWNLFIWIYFFLLFQPMFIAKVMAAISSNSTGIRGQKFSKVSNSVNMNTFLLRIFLNQSWRTIEISPIYLFLFKWFSQYNWNWYVQWSQFAGLLRLLYYFSLNLFLYNYFVYLDLTK